MTMDQRLMACADLPEVQPSEVINLLAPESISDTFYRVPSEIPVGHEAQVWLQSHPVGP